LNNKEETQEKKLRQGLGLLKRLKTKEGGQRNQKAHWNQQMVIETGEGKIAQVSDRNRLNIVGEEIEPAINDERWLRRKGAIGAGTEKITLRTRGRKRISQKKI